jgi:hypothetical protein
MLTSHHAVGVSRCSICRCQAEQSSPDKAKERCQMERIVIGDAIRLVPSVRRASARQVQVTSSRQRPTLGSSARLFHHAGICQSRLQTYLHRDTHVWLVRRKSLAVYLSRENQLWAADPYKDIPLRPLTLSPLVHHHSLFNPVGLPPFTHFLLRA